MLSTNAVLNKNLITEVGVKAIAAALRENASLNEVNCLSDIIM